MNREILYRGKLELNGMWVYGVPLLRKHYNIMVVWDNAISEYENCKIIPETVGQYTGLRDKDGRRIFEGDIVKGDGEYFAVTHSNGVVMYDRGQYLIVFDKQLEDIEVLGAWLDNIEVIGNIHDNPELLEVPE